MSSSLVGLQQCQLQPCGISKMAGEWTEQPEQGTQSGSAWEPYEVVSVRIVFDGESRMSRFFIY